MANKRASFIILGFILAFLLLFYRVFVLVVWPDERLASLYSLSPPRGVIFDRKSNILAVNVNFYDFYLRPARLSDEQKHWIDGVLPQNMFSPAERAAIFTDRDFVYVRRRLTFSQKEAVQNALRSYTGRWPRDAWGLVRKSGRHYPFLETAKVVGHVNIDNKGMAGLEFFFDEDLEKGHSVTTTLDALVSRIALEELAKGVQEAQADYGSAIVMKIRGREILAMVDFPTYNPNEFATINERTGINYALSVAYEPGSVMKVFASAIALDERVVSATEVFHCHGEIEVHGNRVRDGFAHGRVRLAEIIQKSCNVGMIQVADRLSASRWYASLTNFGFGARPAVPLPGRAEGILRPLSRWSGLSKYMTSIGQEIGVSTLQLTLAMAALTDGGVYQTPSLVKGWGVPERRHVLSSNVAREIVQMMERVVSEDGTALSARIEGMAIAGKTGTGQIARADGRGYYPDFYGAFFMGVFPAENPQYVMVVAVNRIHGPQRTGGRVAAPIFSRIIRRMLVHTDYLGGEL